MFNNTGFVETFDEGYKVSLNWQVKIKRGIFMSKGSIRPNRGASCTCGGRFVSTVNPIIDVKVPICNECGKLPTKFVVRKSIPDMNGKSKAKDFYYALDGTPLTSVQQCIGLM